MTNTDLDIQKTSQAASVPTNSRYTFSQSEPVWLTHTSSSKHYFFGREQRKYRHHLTNTPFVLLHFTWFSLSLCLSAVRQHIFIFVRKPEEQTGHWTHVSHHPAPMLQIWHTNGNTTPPHFTCSPAIKSWWTPWCLQEDLITAQHDILDSVFCTLAFMRLDLFSCYLFYFIIYFDQLNTTRLKKNTWRAQTSAKQVISPHTVSYNLY